MKKVLQRARGHSLSHRQGPPETEEALQPSPYEHVGSRTPPRLGTTPLRGDQEPLPSTMPPTTTMTTDIGAPGRAVPGPTRTPVRGSGDGVVAAEQRHAPPRSLPGEPAPPQSIRDGPTNFSRLPPPRGDVARDGGSWEQQTPPSPATIQPQDLASPEFSYLSNMYGGSGSGKAHASPLPSLDPASTAIRTPAYESRHDGPVIPRKEVGSGPASGVHSARSSLDPAGLPNQHTSEGTRTHLRPSEHPHHHPLSSGRTGDTRASDLADGPHSADAYSGTMEDAAEHLRRVVNLNNTADTEVITRQAPAVVQETVVPKVHHVREEKIEREIHTYDIIHRVLPVIDVEVLPPRHFVPVAGGGLKEVTVDELPGRQGHWGIVETVTHPSSSAEPGRPSSPLEPEVIHLPPSIGTDGRSITETIIRHPPTLEVGARETGQTWPMVIAPDHYAAIHGMPAGDGSHPVLEPRRPHHPLPPSHPSVPDVPDPASPMSDRHSPPSASVVGAWDDARTRPIAAPMQTDLRGPASGRSRP